jgi:hypothetical protein
MLYNTEGGNLIFNCRAKAPHLGLEVDLAPTHATMAAAAAEDISA